MTAPDVAAALARLKSRGGYRYRRGELAEPGWIDFDTDLALVTQALADARALWIEACAQWVTDQLADPAEGFRVAKQLRALTDPHGGIDAP